MSKRASLKAFAKDDKGNLPSAAVFVVVLALIIAATATIISATSAQVTSSKELADQLNRQIDAANTRHQTVISDPSSLSSGSNSFTDEGLTTYYRSTPSNTFMGYDTAGQPVWSPVPGTEPYNFTQIITSGTLLCGLENHQVYCWGKATEGQAGNGAAAFSASTPTLTATTSGLQGFTRLYASSKNMCGVEKGTELLWCWGSNSDRVLGAATTITRPAKVDAARKINAATNSVALASHTLCFISSAKAYCNGNLDGDSTTSTSMKTLKDGPADIPAKEIHLTDNTLLVSSTVSGKALYAMSANPNGAAGIAGTSTTPVTTPTLVPALKDATITKIDLATTSGGDSVLVNTSERAYGFGHLYLGDGTERAKLEQPKPLGSGSVYKDVFQTTGGTVCALEENSGATKTFCWGSNTKGTVGDGTTTNTKDPKLIKRSATPAGSDENYSHQHIVSTASDTICVLNAGTETLCWGDNSNGLADPDSPEITITTPQARSGATEKLMMNQNTACRMHDQKTSCWGTNTAGSLGIGYGHTLRLAEQELHKAPTGELVTAVKKGR